MLAYLVLVVQTTSCWLCAFLPQYSVLCGSRDTPRVCPKAGKRKLDSALKNTTTRNVLSKVSSNDQKDMHLVANSTNNDTVQHT